MILTSIGEVGIDYNGREYKFRPSFYAISQIGSPEEIVRCFAAVNGGTFSDLMNKLEKAERLNQFTLPLLKKKQILGEILRAAILVMSCCCEDDTSELFGYYKPSNKGLIYVPGKVPQDKVIILARELMRHGVIGDVKNKGRNNGEYSATFVASEFVSLAIAHLGMSETDAWNMTMTSFRQAMQAKYPPEDDGISSEKHDEMMAWRAKVEEARRNKEKNDG